MAFDFKKVQKELYFPKDLPALIQVPPMQYAAVSGTGDPNDPGGTYQQAISALYAVAYTLRMSYKGNRQIDGFFEYVVPPLEGFWHKDLKYPEDKSRFHWTALLRLPEFIRQEDVNWAKAAAFAKKGTDCSSVFLLQADEGQCVQIMHHGSYDDEPSTVLLLENFAAEHGYTIDLSETRPHHEIYLSDPRKTAVEKRKTAIRLPVRSL